MEIETCLISILLGYERAHYDQFVTIQATPSSGLILYSQDGRGTRGGQKMNQKPEHQNFQVGGRNCGDISLTELKNIWV